MKKIYAISLLVVLLCACTKQDENTADGIPKSVSRVAISPEMIIQKKGMEYYVSVFYDTDHDDADEVELSTGGTQGIKIGEGTQSLSGKGNRTLLFKFPAIQTAGDIKFKVKIKNKVLLAEKEQLYRVTDDYSITTVWTQMTKDYLSVVSGTTIRSTTGGFFVTGFAYNEPNMGFGIHSAIDNEVVSNDPNKTIRRQFIPGISGAYTASFRNAVLQFIRIENGNSDVTPGYTAKKTHNEISAVYGNYLSRKIGDGIFDNQIIITRYGAGEFYIDVYEKGSDVYSMIVRK